MCGRLRFKTSTLGPTLMALLSVLTLVVAPQSRAAVETVNFHISGLMCSLCAQQVKQIISQFEGVEKVDIDPKEGLAHVVADKEEPIDLYDIDKELSDRRLHSAYPPWKTMVKVTGKVKTFTQHYGHDAHVHERYALHATGTDQVFVLLEGETLDKLINRDKVIDEVGLPKEITIMGRVARYDGNFPLLELIPKEETDSPAAKGSETKGSESK